jgi:hypothetical protein
MDNFIKGLDVLEIDMDDNLPVYYVSTQSSKVYVSVSKLKEFAIGVASYIGKPWQEIRHDMLNGKIIDLNRAFHLKYALKQETLKSLYE